MKIDIDSNYILLNTVFVGDNFGSSLQAFALKHFIQDTFEVPCHIVERREEGIKAKLNRLRIRIMIFFKSLESPKLLKNTWESQINKFRRISEVDCYPDTIRKHFSAFTESNLGPVFLPQKNLTELAQNEKCIRCITGSDQIWNPTVDYLKPNNFLLFSPKEKNIAYAASLGASQIPYYNYYSFKWKIRNIKYISVREEAAKELLYAKFGVTAKVCVDPVVLVGKEFWLVNKVPTGINVPYTFCYFLNKPNQQARSLIEEKISHGEKVVVLSRNNFANYGLNVQNIVDISPLQFVSYVCDADSVLTDSFHGMMFSILLNKEFYVFERDYESHTPQPSRIITLLDQLGIAERYVKGIETIVDNSNINYAQINTIIEEKRTESKAFLMEAINNGKCRL